MAGIFDAIATDYISDHVIGKWHSVPDLRLRDHRFTVPLFYSADPATAAAASSPKISIFAREVVSGVTTLNHTTNTT